MLHIAPMSLLALLLAITAAALLTHRILRHAHRRRLRLLASQWKMHYSPHDLFHLSAQLAAAFPIPHAHDVRILDRIYGLDGDHHRYLCTAHYTPGPTVDAPRQQLALSLHEPCQSPSGPFSVAGADILVGGADILVCRGHYCPQLPDSLNALASAPLHLPLLQQYRHLHDAGV
jgi:hypothetical protein